MDYFDNNDELLRAALRYVPDSCTDVRSGYEVGIYRAGCNRPHIWIEFAQPCPKCSTAVIVTRLYFRADGSTAVIVHVDWPVCRSLESCDDSEDCGEEDCLCQ